MNSKNLLKEIKNGICIITINRPKHLNALNTETIEELSYQIRASNNDSGVRCIILTGSEERAFVAGADIKEFMSYNKDQGEHLARKGQDKLFNVIEKIETPTIAAINGFALGGGLELAMSCNIRVASTNAKMGLPEVSLGVIPGYGGTQRLAQLVGKGRALEMIITAEMISATKAGEWGLVNHVCSLEELLPKAMNIAEKIKNNSPMAIAKAIKSVNSGFVNSCNGFEVEIKEFGSCFGTNEFMEGTKAFLERRKAKF